MTTSLFLPDAPGKSHDYELYYIEVFILCTEKKHPSEKYFQNPKTDFCISDIRYGNLRADMVR